MDVCSYIEQSVSERLEDASEIILHGDEPREWEDSLQYHDVLPVRYKYLQTPERRRRPSRKPKPIQADKLEKLKARPTQWTPYLAYSVPVPARPVVPQGLIEISADNWQKLLPTLLRFAQEGNTVGMMQEALARYGLYMTVAQMTALPLILFDGEY